MKKKAVKCKCKHQLLDETEEDVACDCRVAIFKLTRAQFKTRQSVKAAAKIIPEGIAQMRWKMLLYLLTNLAFIRRRFEGCLSSFFSERCTNLVVNHGPLNIHHNLIQLWQILPRALLLWFKLKADIPHF